MTVPQRKRPHRPLFFTLGSPAKRWASIVRRSTAMSFELILPFLRPIEPLLLDESISEIMGNPDASWWYERDGIIRREKTISFAAGKLRTGLEVIANQLGKTTRRRQPHTPCAAPGWEPLGGGHSAGCSAYASTHHSKVYQSPLHSR